MEWATFVLDVLKNFGVAVLALVFLGWCLWHGIPVLWSHFRETHLRWQAREDAARMSEGEFLFR